MKHTSTFAFAAAVLAASAATASAVTLPLSDDVAREKAEAVLAKLTLDQKVSLLGGWHTMYLVDIPEAGIPRKWAMSDATHGIKPEHSRWDWPHVPGHDNRCTVLPCGSALAMTWNPELAAAHGHVQGEQMRDRGKDQMLGPGVNINRTPLCGRNWEYLSEDPYLNARLAVPMIRAVQTHGVAATVKHFCVNNQEWNRTTVDTLADERTLHEIYLPAFQAAIQAGGSLCVMSSYNKFNGQYASENAYLQRGLLRDRWGFRGLLVTDWGGHHSTVPAALNGGNVEMDRGKGIIYFTDWKNGRFPLADAVRADKVPEATVDEMALHVLWTMAKTGFLDGLQEQGCRFTEQHRATARTIGEESIVLLRNDRGVLPLRKEGLKKVCVVGRQSLLRQCHLGASAGAQSEYEITPFEGLKESLGKEVELELFPLGKECGDADTPTPIPEGQLETFQRDGGDAFATRAWELYSWAEGNEWSTNTLPVQYVKYPTGAKLPAVRYEARVRAAETGDHVFSLAPGAKVGGVSIFVDGRRVVHYKDGQADDMSRIALERDKVYSVRIDVLRPGDEKAFVFGWLQPSQLAAVGKDKEKVLREADAVIVFTGSQLGYGRARESEGQDMPSMQGAEGHDEEIAALLKSDLKNLVVVHRSGAQMEMPWADDCPTLVHLSYLGQEGGRAFARVLFGDVSPSGRLASSWPRRYEDLGVAQRGTYNGTNVLYKERFYVGYRWFDAQDIKPLFPFGYGLGYTTFDWGAPTVSKTPDGWTVSVTVRNTGKVAGKDVVQLYVAPTDAKVERVKKELKGFAKTRLLQPGESETVTLAVRARDLAYYDDFLHRWRAPKGAYELLVAASAADVRARLAIEQTEDRVLALDEECVIAADSAACK